LVNIKGRITINLIKEAMERVFKNPHFRRNADILWDVREAETASASTEEVMKLMELVESFREIRGENYRVAVVVGKEADFGMARMLEMYVDAMPFHMMVFRSMDHARRWIGQNAMREKQLDVHEMTEGVFADNRPSRA
jgi:hypothetical protein